MDLRASLVGRARNKEVRNTQTTLSAGEFYSEEKRGRGAEQGWEDFGRGVGRAGKGAPEKQGS